MKKGIFILIGILAIFAIGLLFVKPSLGGGNVTTGNVVGYGNNNGVNGAQEVVLSYKNYNYYPEVIEVKKGVPVKITADSSVRGCYTTFVIPAFGVKHSFTQSKTLEFTPDKTGTFAFSCGMGMGRGQLVVK